jgi:DNA-binding transcriptional ArsR family regulator
LNEEIRMDDIFQALADPTRRAMLRRLAQGPATVTELAAPYPMSLTAASRHIKVLENARLLRREVEWRTHTCHLTAAPLAAAAREISHYEKFWTDRLDTLEAMLRDEDARKLAEPDDTTNPSFENGDDA